jgi:hypothetical protein
MKLNEFFAPLPNGKDTNHYLLSVVESFEGNHRGRWVVADYQRGRVWSDDQASAFVGNVISGGVCPLIWINRSESRPDMEIIDGQQRLTSIYRWIKGEIPATPPHMAGTKIYYSDLDAVTLNILDSRVNIPIRYVDLSRKEVLALYLRLNAGGVPHTAEELDRVRALIAQEG